MEPLKIVAMKNDPDLYEHTFVKNFLAQSAPNPDPELTEPFTLSALWPLCLGSVSSVTHALLVFVCGSLELCCATLLGVSALVAGPLTAANLTPVRVAPVIDGHVHPGFAVTRSGALLVMFNRQGVGGKEIFLSRSLDGGKTP